MGINVYLISAVILAVSIVVLHVIAVDNRHSNRLRGVPRLGAHPGILGNTTTSSFQKTSQNLINEGYHRYRKQVYSLWTTGMDRAIVPHDYLPELGRLSRNQLGLTASVRHAGEYTGMDIAEKGPLAFNVISVNLTQHIGSLIQPAYIELKHALEERVNVMEQKDGFSISNVHQLVIHLISRSTALAFVGSDLCRDEEWLTTAIGYARDSVTLQRELGKYWRATWPIVAPFLASYKRLQGRFVAARKFLGPEIEKRRALQALGHQQPKDLLQWLINQSKDSESTVDMISRRMLFISLASIDTTAITLTNVIFELLGRVGTSEALRQEFKTTLPDDRSEVAYDNLKALKLLDSFMKESQRMNPMGLVTFNRQLKVPFRLPDGTNLPQGTYLSVPQWPVLNDPLIYPEPDKFDASRFIKLNDKDHSERWTFASYNSDWPGWGIGKFSCPGRFWASTQMKLIIIILLDEFDIRLPQGQSDRPKNKIRGESNLPDFMQTMRLKRRV